jgi:hypothetical protein
MRAAVPMALIFLSLLLYAQTAEECANMVPSERDGCYLGRARTPEECMPISDIHIREQCFAVIAEQHAKSYRECDALYSDYQPLCYARITYENNKNQMACEQLQQDFRQACYIYYAVHKPPGQISSCEKIPPNYKEKCMARFFEKASLQTESDCAMFGERYKESCVDYLNSKTNILQRLVLFIDSAWAFVSSQWTIAGMSLVLFLAFIVFGARIISRGLSMSKK